MAGYSYMRKYLVERGCSKESCDSSWWEQLQGIGKPCLRLGKCPFGGNEGTVIDGEYYSLASKDDESLPSCIKDLYCDRNGCFCPTIVHTDWVNSLLKSLGGN